MDINFAIYGRKQQIDLICRAEETNIDEAREGKQGHFSSEEKNYYFLWIFFFKKKRTPPPKTLRHMPKKRTKYLNPYPEARPHYSFLGHHTILIHQHRLV